MNDFNRSIIGNPASWTKPADVARRESEQREGIERARQQSRDDEERRKRAFQYTPTPQQDEARGFAERYALNVDATTGEAFLTPHPEGEVVLGPNGGEIAARGNGISDAPHYRTLGCGAFGFSDIGGQDDDFGS